MIIQLPHPRKKRNSWIHQAIQKLDESWCNYWKQSNKLPFSLFQKLAPFNSASAKKRKLTSDKREFFSLAVKKNCSSLLIVGLTICDCERDISQTCTLRCFIRRKLFYIEYAKRSFLVLIQPPTQCFLLFFLFRCFNGCYLLSVVC